MSDLYKTMEPTVESLYQAYKQRLLGFFIARRLSREQAEDFVQDVFLRYKRADYKLNSVQARAAIFKIAQNVFFDHLRNLEVRRHAGVSNEQMLQIQPDIALPDYSPGPDRTFQGKQELQNVIAKISALPPKCREVFLDFRFRDLSQKEISAKRGISLSMVEKHVAVAIRKLKPDDG